MLDTILKVVQSSGQSAVKSQHDSASLNSSSDSISLHSYDKQSCHHSVTLSVRVVPYQPDHVVADLLAGLLKMGSTRHRLCTQSKGSMPDVKRYQADSDNIMKWSPLA